MINIKNGVEKFKENFSEAKNKPRSKRKSLLLGFTTVLSIFGLTLLAPVLPAVAKDIPKDAPKPGQVCPSPATPLVPSPSQLITTGLSGAAATICALAITSGSFLVGGVCGVVVVVGILKAQGK
jgi:MFS family permease